MVVRNFDKTLFDLDNGNYEFMNADISDFIYIENATTVQL